MGRVEPKNEPGQENQPRRQDSRRDSVAVDRTPGKAEGDESTVDEALKNQKTRR